MDKTALQPFGARLILVCALVGVVAMAFAYFSIDSGIAGEPGTLLVIASSALLAVFGFILGSGFRSTAFRAFITISAILNIAGTGLAGYLLHSTALVILMLLCLAGWLLHVFAPDRSLV